MQLRALHATPLFAVCRDSFAADAVMPPYPPHTPPCRADAFAAIDTIMLHAGLLFARRHTLRAEARYADGV